MATTNKIGSGVKPQLLDEARQRMAEFKEILCELIRIPTDNPPGDTTECFRFLKQLLESRSIDFTIYEPKVGNPNLICQLGNDGNPRHLVLNGHIDQFSVSAPEKWSFHPYSGRIEDKRILGRGACDMKAGSTASLVSFLMAKEHNLVTTGKLTLALVSDEETGGTWGTKWLLDQIPALTGTAVLNGEPSGTASVVIGHKGINWLRLSTYGRGGHGALPSANSNAIEKMFLLARAIKLLNGHRVEPPADLVSYVEMAKKSLEATDHGKEMGWVFDSITVNPGLIIGGSKTNVIPQECELTFDIRTPVGISHAELRDRVERLLLSTGIDHQDWKYEWLLVSEPSYSKPDAEIVQMVIQNVESVVGRKPNLIGVSYGSADTRFWQYRGVPVVLFGPTPFNMGRTDEYVLEQDFEKVVLVHLGTVVDYLCPNT